MQLPGEFSPFIEKKVVFCLVVGGVTPPPPLSGPTTKKNTFFYVCLCAHHEAQPRAPSVVRFRAQLHWARRLGLHQLLRSGRLDVSSSLSDQRLRQAGH